tara:strand:+ start:222 stop:455 length:234 start_codon:yes stop_codon:yes gene_type:complete
MATPKTIPSNINGGDMDKTADGDFIYITAILINIANLNIDGAGEHSIGPINLSGSPIRCQKFVGSSGGDVAYFIKSH